MQTLFPIAVAVGRRTMSYTTIVQESRIVTKRQEKANYHYLYPYEGTSSQSQAVLPPKHLVNPLRQRLVEPPAICGAVPEGADLWRHERCSL